MNSGVLVVSSYARTIERSEVRQKRIKMSHSTIKNVFGDEKSSDQQSKPRVGCRYKCAAGSGMRDGGRSIAIGLQEQVANHRKRLGSKALVVSVTEKVPSGIRCEPKKTNTSELPFKCRKCSDDIETGGVMLIQDKPVRYLLTGRAVSGIEAASGWFWLLC
jgi:hypothetical protein